MQVGDERVAVVGLGHVGLPIALRLAIEGVRTVGVDIDREHLRRLGAGETNLVETWRGQPIQMILRRALTSDLLTLSAEAPVALAGCSDCVVTVGIPVSEGILDFTSFRSVIATAASSLPPEALLMVRSTIPAGTMQSVVAPLAREAGRRLGGDLLLAYCPERMAEGAALEEVASLPLVVAAEDALSLERAKRLLSSLGARECIPTHDFRLAELVKAVENAYRDLNIAFANEMAALCRALGVDTAQLVRTANTHPRVQMLLPGPGVGGFCLPNAHHYLAHAALERGVPLTLTAQARAVNDGVPALVADLVREGLIQAGKSLDGAKVAVLGVAMKSFCGDDRLSPVYPLIDELVRRGARVASFDPAVATGCAVGASSQGEAVRDADAVVVAARQDGLDLDPESLVRLMNPRPVIVDTRDAVDRLRAADLGCILLAV